ncbi:conserved hypothetical protein [Vibrio chagasii]|uniref:hypothetical protein n=1 Tax=Vibrio TaxID=662 RepID=UPI0014935BA8|nr:hypothetical protein [Vibrio chagasii]NOI97974.1 hypothetical protein [Vibrio sp. T3Y01]CAH6796336.1 conserved hypothetical protein [Vibrio chagasii]CAH6809849.1 conserved hypothetical protein [Vibrio chagasii]CAH6910011.1 conserved hypothetical protein [Vibrio chagasii]CAH6917841.1 conserved hypothetical protein [Vibrio chagasii]
MCKKVYLAIIHVLAVIGVSTVYLSVSASLGIDEQRTVVERPDGCLTAESDQVFSPEGNRAIHAQFSQCSGRDNIMQVWLQPDVTVTRYQLIYESVYNSDEVIDISWRNAGDIVIGIPSTVYPSSVVSNQSGVEIYVENK